MASRIALWIALLLMSPMAWAAVATVTLDASTLERLATADVGGSVEVAAFPIAPGRFGPVRFERIDVLAPGAKVIEISASGERELPRSARVHLIGSSSDGSVRIGLSFDPGLASPPNGYGFGSRGDFAVVAERSGVGWAFSAVEPKAVLPAGVVLDFPANNDTMRGPGSAPSPLDTLRMALQPAPSATTPARLAVVGVDTDASFLQKRFSNNTGAASTWIADLFLQMNVIYRRDLDVVLMQGTTFLRTGSDPFTNADTVASGAALNEFGDYWQANYSSGANAVSRSFAMLLSGNGSSGNSASGIAWINSYCRTAGNGGSYSVNQVFTNPSVPVSNSNSIVAHELGHNFGAYHSHCSNNTTGVGPASSSTIDQCFNGEGSGGCYTGAVSCPGGPGSLMSYCHFGAPNGANCGTSQFVFAPAHITRLRSLIATNSPSCLRPETILTTGFDS